MFLDLNILKIIQRSGNMSDLDAMQLMQEYTGLVMETISTVSMEYFMEKDNVEINSPKDMMNFMDGLPEKIKKEPELLKKIQDELLEVDLKIVEQFNKTAAKGDQAYMEVYLLSKIKEYKKKIDDLEKQPEEEQSDDNS